MIDLWMWCKRSSALHFHQLVGRRPWNGVTGEKHCYEAICGATRTNNVVTSNTPPDHLELCLKCIFVDFEAFVVYRCADDAGAVLYIGKTNDLVSRLRQHEYVEPRSRLWWPRVRQVTVLGTYLDDDEAMAAEKAAIETERPPFNSVFCKAVAA